MGAHSTPLRVSGAVQLLNTPTECPRAAKASASDRNAASAPPSGRRSGVAPSNSRPSSVMTMRAISVVSRRVTSEPLAKPSHGRLCRIDGQAIHQGVGGAIVEIGLAHQRAPMPLGLRHRRARPPRRIVSGGTGAEKADGRHTRGGGYVHETGIVADKER